MKLRHRQSFLIRTVIYLIFKIIFCGFILVAIHSVVESWVVSLSATIILCFIAQRILTKKTTYRAILVWNTFYSKYGCVSIVRDKGKGMGVIDDCAYRISAAAQENGIFFDNEWAVDARKPNSNISAFIAWDSIVEIKITKLNQYKDAIFAQIKLRENPSFNFVIPWNNKFAHYIPSSLIVRYVN